MPRTQVKCKSGQTGWRSTLHENYDNDREQWLSCSETYGLANRLGYDDAEEAWDDNPIIEGSVIPSDFRVAPKDDSQ